MKSLRIQLLSTALLLVLGSACDNVKTPQGVIGAAYLRVNKSDFSRFQSLLSGQASKEWGNRTDFDRLHEWLFIQRRDFTTSTPKLVSVEAGTQNYEVEVFRIGRQLLKVQTSCTQVPGKDQACTISDLRLDLVDRPYPSNCSDAHEGVCPSETLKKIGYRVGRDVITFECARNIAPDGSVSHSVRAFLPANDQVGANASSLGDRELDQRMMLFCIPIGLSPQQIIDIEASLISELENLPESRGAHAQVAADETLERMIRQ